MEKQKYDSEYGIACPTISLPAQMKLRTGLDIPIINPSSGSICSLFLKDAMKQAISTNKFPNPRILQRFSLLPG